MQKRINKKYIIRILASLSAIVIVSVLVSSVFGQEIKWPDIMARTGLRDNSDAGKAPFSVHFIDVGQGDCIFIKTDNGNALIDSGDTGNSEKIIRYLRNHNAENLDYIFITHPDADHIGSMPEIIENLGVSEIIMPDIDTEYLPTTKTYERFLETILRLNIKTTIAHPSDIYRLGDAVISVFGPVSSDSELNNMSLVLKIDYGKNSILFAGDAEVEEENEIIDTGAYLKADVLKAGHHGSKGSSGMNFVKAVMPSTVIISCGRENKFGHPSIESLDRFSQIGAEVLRTDFYGTIIASGDGEILKFYLERDGAD